MINKIIILCSLYFVNFYKYSCILFTQNTFIILFDMLSIIKCCHLKIYRFKFKSESEMKCQNISPHKVVISNRFHNYEISYNIVPQ